MDSWCRTVCIAIAILIKHLNIYGEKTKIMKKRLGMAQFKKKKKKKDLAHCMKAFWP